MMERIQELLTDLQRVEDEDDVKLKDSLRLQKYKLEAIECEKKIQERRKLKKKELLEKVSAIEKKLKERDERQNPEKFETPNEDMNSERSWQNEAEETDMQIMIPDQNSNYIEAQEDEHLPESSLSESFSKLEDLQNQQKELENWYKIMSGQFEEEYLKLTDKYNEMKCKILKKKQYYLKTSQNFIATLNAGSLSNDVRDQSLSTLEGKYKTVFNPRVHRDYIEKNEQKPSGSFIQEHGNADLSGYRKAVLKQLNMGYARRNRDNEQPSASSYVSDGFKTSVCTSDAALYDANNAINVNNPQSTVTSYVDTSNVSERSGDRKSQSNSMQVADTSELIDKTLHISPIRATDEANFSPTKMGNSQPQVSKPNQSQRHRFALSPSQDYRFSSSMHRQLENLSNLSCSTPIGKISLTEKVNPALQIARDKFEIPSDKFLTSSFDRLGAVALGYLTRKLFHTEKVQTLVKTIKDTKTVLASLKRETSVINRRSTCKAEQQFKANLQHELKNAQARLYDILIESSSKERIEIISRSRLAAAARENNQYFKNRSGPASSFSSKNSRLSSATQKSIRRRQDHLSNQRILTRPSTSPALKRDVEGKKQRKSWDVRSLKPTLSDASPFFSERKQNRNASKTSEAVGSVRTDELSKPPTKEDLVTRKSSRKRQLAVNLSRKINATNG